MLAGNTDQAAHLRTKVMLQVTKLLGDSYLHLNWKRNTFNVSRVTEVTKLQILISGEKCCLPD